MDEERWRRHHAVIARAHELIATADELLDECAIRDATRPFDRPDALQAWAAGMPAKPEPIKKQESARVSPAELKVMALRAEVEQHKRKAAQFRREVRQYREGLEKAIGKVIAGQRKETDAMRTEIDKLRAEIDAMRGAAATPSVRRLVQSRRTIGHAVSA